MNSETRQWLHETLDAARLVHEKVSTTSPDAMRSSAWFRGAAHYQLVMIGEALGRIRRADPALAEHIPAVHEWISLRNIVAHLYDRIDEVMIWDAIVVDLPVLIEAISVMLSKEPDAPGNDG